MIAPPVGSMYRFKVHPHRLCGQLSDKVVNLHSVSSAVQGVTTEVIAADGDSKRRIVLNRYD
ncbi:DUF2574 family protein [Escherichia coli]|uniref:DUF2574 family protein n=1 Tax=Escherichia coli TaxID=562 RepID=UPI0024E17814